MPRIKGIAWLGVRTDKFDDMEHLFGTVFNLKIKSQADGFREFEASNGDVVEIFSTTTATNTHFTTGPVAGFLVDDIEQSVADMKAAGVQFIGDIDGDPGLSRWAHFRGPDGNVYELKWYPEPVAE